MEGFEALKLQLDTGFPWPLDAVQNWFESLWNWISEAADYAVKSLSSLIPDWIKGWFEQAWKIVQNIGFEAWNLTDEWTSGIGEPIKSLLRFILLPAAVSKKTFDDVLWPRVVWLRDAISGALSEAQKQIGYTFDGAFNVVGDTIQKALAGLGDVFKPVADFLWGLIKPVAEPIKNALEGVYNFFTKDVPKALGDFYSWLKTGWDNFVKGVSDFGKSAAEFFSNVGKFLTEDLPKIAQAVIGWIFERASDIAKTLSSLVKPVSDAVYGAYKDFVNSVTSGFTASMKPGSPDKEVLDSVKELVKQLNENVKKLAERAQKGSPVAEDLIANVTNTAVITLAGSEVAEVAGMAADQIHPVKNIGIREKVKDFISKLGLPSLTAGVFMGWATYGAIPHVARWWRKQFRPTLPSEGDLRTWHLRGITPEDQTKELLSEHGYSDDFIDKMMKSWWIIPGVNDLITFAVREVIPPEDFYKWSAQQGLSEYWAGKYWEAHWVLPGFGDLREAMWRDIISEEEFGKYVIWHDYRPEPRPGISKSDQQIMRELSYNLPSRIEARYMLRWGTIGKDELKQLEKARGIHPDWLERIADAEYLNQLIEERNRIKTEHQNSFAKGYLTKDQLEAKLREVKFIEDEIKYLLDASSESRRRELTTIALNTLKERWKRGKITKDDFISNAKLLGLDGDYVKAYADQVEASFREIEKVDLTVDERKSIASFLMRKYEAGYITQDELQTRLEALELSSDEIDLRIRLANEEYDFNLKEMLKDAYISAYRKDQIDEPRLRELLTSLGLRGDYVETTINAEKIKKKVERVEVESLSDRLAKLEYQEKQQLLYIQDLSTDLDAKQKIYQATQDLWSERIKKLQDEISITTDPAKVEKLQYQLTQTQIQAQLAVTKAEAAYVDVKEKMESAQAKLDEIRREKDVVRKAMSAS